MLGIKGARSRVRGPDQHSLVLVGSLHFPVDFAHHSSLSQSLSDPIAGF